MILGPFGKGYTMQLLSSPRSCYRAEKSATFATWTAAVAYGVVGVVELPPWLLLLLATFVLLLKLFVGCWTVAVAYVVTYQLLFVADVPLIPLGCFPLVPGGFFRKLL